MPLLVGLTAFGLYAWSTPSVSGLGDGPEFTVGLATAGLVHPTGYPLYIITGHLFAQAAHELGASWALAANLWSGTGAALAVAIFFAVAQRLAPHSLISAALPAALLASNPLLMREAVEAEVNAWALAWTMGLVAFFVAGVARIETGAPAPSARSGAVWGLACGVGLAHHLTSLLVAAPLTLALSIALARRGELRPRLVALAILGAAVPLLAYGLVAWRAAHPAPGQWREIAPGWSGFWGHVTGARYRMFLGFFGPDAESRRHLTTGVTPYLTIGLPLLAAACLRTNSGHRLLWGGLLTASMLVLAFALNYGVPDPAPYFLPAVGIGLLGTTPLISSLWERGGVGTAMVAIGVGAAFVLIGIGHIDARERRGDTVRFDRDVRSLWAFVPPDSAILLWPADQVARLVEYQSLRNERTAVWVGTPEWLLDPRTRRELRKRFGADPVARMRIPHAPRDAPWGEAVRQEFLAAAVSRLASESSVPVYWFDPTVPVLEIVPRSANRIHGAR